MRPVPSMYRDLISTSHRTIAKVSSFRAGKQLAADVPILDGSITYDDTADLRRRCSITVPVRDLQSGISWDPGDNPDHPLNWYGQMLHIQMGIGLPRGGTVWFNHGWYLIDNWDLDETDSQVEVSAVDLSRLIDDARHYTEETPGRGTTYPAEFERLLDGLLPLVVDDGLGARVVNANTVWDRERRKNLDDLCKAWPARWYVDDEGYAHVAAERPAVPEEGETVTVLEWGAQGTVTGRSRSGERGRLYNAVVVQGKDGQDDETQPWAVAEITDPKSPIRVGGPFGRRPRFYQSDLLTSSSQCLATARSMLGDASRMSRTEPITAVPDYAMELGDAVQVRTKGDYFTGRVQSIELPLTASGGEMQVTVSTVPPDNDDEEGT